MKISFCLSSVSFICTIYAGVEVKAGESLKVQPDFGKLIHISQAALGEAHKDQWKNYESPLDEQEYASEVKYDVGIEPSGEELNDLSKALNKLWELDLNRLVPGKDYQIDCGEGKKV
ncbi:unnamed protein product [Fraxinus pennsylvanica]|uniref:Uncharacterized protein n=1 Tax=Fraxinus pennsylvanica TaxID=56036 RepID=A0AAD1Z4C2_9LAMI|nr:unnamed protein product [Fraxinus pennsylvanica]